MASRWEDSGTGKGYQIAQLGCTLPVRNGSEGIENRGKTWNPRADGDDASDESTAPYGFAQIRFGDVQVGEIELRRWGRTAKTICGYVTVAKAIRRKCIG
jgi:hypothetical protein